MADFKQFNGYKVKDETARNEIAKIKTDIIEIESNIAEIENNLPYVTPQMFGAKGDGVTDDTQALKNAITNADTTNKFLVVPYGTYLINDTLIIPSKFSIVGLNREKCIIKMVNGTNKVLIESVNFNEIANGTSSDQPNRILISGLTIDGNNNGTSNGINLYCSEPFLEDIYIRNIGGIGLYTTGKPSLLKIGEGIEGTFRNIYVMFTGNHGIRFDGPNDSYFENITCVNASQKTDNLYDSFSANNSGRMSHYHGWNFSDDYGYNRPRYALTVTGEGNFEVDNSHLEGGRTGSLLVLGGSNNKFDNCYFYASGGTFLIYLDADFCQFNGCTYGGKLIESQNDLTSAIVLAKANAVNNGAGHRFTGVHIGDWSFVDETNGGGNLFFSVTCLTAKDFSIAPKYTYNTYMNNALATTESATNRSYNFPIKPCVGGTPIE